MAQHFSLSSGRSLCGRQFCYRAQKQKEKKARCVSLLPSQSHKYIKLKIPVIVLLSHPPVTKVLNINQSYVITSLFELAE